MQRHKTVESYIESSNQWRDELRKLRRILTSTKLDETVKWGAPCYTYQGKNVVGIGAFKSYVGLWFFQGSLLPDPANVLISAQGEKTKALRQWRFDTARDIKANAIKAYVRAAMALVDSGEEIKPARKASIAMPAVLKSALAKNNKASAAFKALTPGKQREYMEYIAAAKRDETKQKRIVKILPMVLAGQGLNDKYRSC